METNLVGLSGPIMISIDVTYRCNFRCKHCFNGSGAPLLGDELSDAELLTIAKSVGVVVANRFLDGRFCVMLARQLSLKVHIPK